MRATSLSEGGSGGEGPEWEERGQTKKRKWPRSPPYRNHQAEARTQKTCCRAKTCFVFIGLPDSDNITRYRLSVCRAVWTFDGYTPSHHALVVSVIDLFCVIFFAQQRFLSRTSGLSRDIGTIAGAQMPRADIHQNKATPTPAGRCPPDPA